MVTGVIEGMDFGICGLLDIIIVVLGLIVILLGYRKGFLKKVLSVVGFFAIAILSFVYCKQFATFLIQKDFIYPEIYNPIYNHLLNQTLEAGLTPNSTLSDLLTIGLGLPDVMARIFANVLNVSGDINQICAGISQYLSTIAMNIISFLIILVGASIVVLILKIIADAARKVKVVRVIDGF